MRPERRKARAELAVATREASRKPDDPAAASALADRQREYATLSLEDHIRDVVASAPPLTGEQVERLRGLLDLPCRDAEHAGTAESGGRCA